MKPSLLKIVSITPIACVALLGAEAKAAVSFLNVKPGTELRDCQNPNKIVFGMLRTDASLMTADDLSKKVLQVEGTDSADTRSVEGCIFSYDAVTLDGNKDIEPFGLKAGRLLRDCDNPKIGLVAAQSGLVLKVDRYNGVHHGLAHASAFDKNGYVQIGCVALDDLRPLNRQEQDLNIQNMNAVTFLGSPPKEKSRHAKAGKPEHVRPSYSEPSRSYDEDRNYPMEEAISALDKENQRTPSKEIERPQAPAQAPTQNFSGLLSE